MIRQKDLWGTYQAFYFWSLIGFLPLEFNRKTGKVRVLITGWRRFLWNVWLLNSLSLTIFKYLRLFQCTFSIQVSFADYFVTFVKCITGILNDYWHISNYCFNPKENDMIFNQLKIQDEDNTTERRSYTIQEWLIIFTAQIFLIGYPITCYALNIYSPDTPEFLSSLLPNPKNGFFFALLCIHELVTFCFWMCGAAYGTYVQLAFIQQTKDGIENSVNCLREGRFNVTFRNLTNECSHLKVQRLGMVLFNKAYSNMIFAQKLYFITLSTICWYGSIVLFDVDPVQFGIFFYWTVSASPFFVILYDKGFKIPGLMDSWKNQILIVTKELHVDDSKTLVEKQIRSIPNSGIKVGGFNQLERESSPIFLNFVVNKVADILISFPRK